MVWESLLSGGDEDERESFKIFLSGIHKVANSEFLHPRPLKKSYTSWLTPHDPCLFRDWFFVGLLLSRSRFPTECSLITMFTIRNGILCREVQPSLQSCKVATRVSVVGQWIKILHIAFQNQVNLTCKKKIVFHVAPKTETKKKSLAKLLLLLLLLASARDAIAMMRQRMTSRGCHAWLPFFNAFFTSHRFISLSLSLSVSVTISRPGNSSASGR